ncbi:hypothetical protein GCM10010145_34390 [Streptomyces ruber]|uniref:Anti-sigma factor antagonist n=2 Tax=Streptomyces TaxID=1883 RepID=A0A918BF69_9ACTN|nr:anti-sigma factor antagonist [Streptomyces ruber]GGQ61358.1 hypothetical protein GCM10010145_34390 [Streptomyces ruber]
MSEDGVLFGLEVRTRRDPLVIALWGELDVLATLGLSDRLTRLVQQDCAFVVLDLLDVSFLDCGGLRLLLRVRHRVRAGHGRLILVLDQPFLLSFLLLAGLDGVFDVVGDLDSALARRFDPPHGQGTPDIAV